MLMMAVTSVLPLLLPVLLAPTKYLDIDYANHAPTPAALVTPHLPPHASLATLATFSSEQHVSLLAQIQQYTIAFLGLVSVAILTVNHAQCYIQIAPIVNQVSILTQPPIHVGHHVQLATILMPHHESA
jgi:hypothetical protein